MNSNYQAFLTSKRPTVRPFGFDVPASQLNRHLFDWQRRVVQWSLLRGRAALFEECGLGKTLQQLAWAEQVAKRSGKPVVIHTPVGVRRQTQTEAERFGIDCPVTVANKQSEVRPGINLVNYEKIHLFNSDTWGGVVLDECFPAGTKVDTPLGVVRIEDIQEGGEIFNAAGVDIVADVHRREVQYAVAFTAGSRITTSPNHPVFTQRGWVSSQDLKPGDSVLQTDSAMRMVSEDVSTSAVYGIGTYKILREILLSEMAYEPAGASCEGSYQRDAREDWKENIGLAEKRFRGCQEEHRANPFIESDAKRRVSKKGVCHIESHEAQTFRAWGEWTRDDFASKDFEGCTGAELDGGICVVFGKTNSGLSHKLQNRLSQSRAKNSYRSGWSLSSLPEISRPKERCETGFVRVESLEILEQGNPELERLRDEDGKLYFYDLGATRHPSYSVSGLLVHNSSVLKAFTGKIKQMLCDAYKLTPYRLACTATPAPNDHMELGNHSEFLGVLPSREMLSRWFVNDTMKAGGYRLRGHAKDDFWRWVASWAVCLSKPSDIGGDDSGYELPELRTHRHIVEAEDMEPTPGMLFNVAQISATSLYEVKRATAESRVRKAVELARASDGPCLIWCDTNDEADRLASELPEANEVRGADSEDEKDRKMKEFSSGECQILITKPSVAGFGMNWQHCHYQIFAGLTFSFESFYQAVRRCWRFGQTRPVDVHLVMAECDSTLEKTIGRKQADHAVMQSGMADAMRQATSGKILDELRPSESQEIKSIIIPEWMKSKGNQS
jgi:hypothetical protein